MLQKKVDRILKGYPHNKSYILLLEFCSFVRPFIPIFYIQLSVRSSPFFTSDTQSNHCSALTRGSDGLSARRVRGTKSRGPPRLLVFKYFEATVEGGHWPGTPPCWKESRLSLECAHFQIKTKRIHHLVKNYLKPFYLLV